MPREPGAGCPTCGIGEGRGGSILIELAAGEGEKKTWIRPEVPHRRLAGFGDCGGTRGGRA